MESFCLLLWCDEGEFLLPRCTYNLPEVSGSSLRFNLLFLRFVAWEDLTEPWNELFSSNFSWFWVGVEGGWPFFEEGIGIRSFAKPGIISTTVAYRVYGTSTPSKLLSKSSIKLSDSCMNLVFILSYSSLYCLSWWIFCRQATHLSNTCMSVGSEIFMSAV